ncbi:MAG: hypothetical protein ACKVT0_07115 [Planctomycetaceae bacterium]
MNGRRILFLVSVFLLAAFVAYGKDEDPFEEFAARVAANEDASITIEIRLARFNAGRADGTKTKIGKLICAAVYAGGTQIEVDCSKNPIAERGFAKNATYNHGDSREPRVNILGTLEFRPEERVQHPKIRPVIIPISVEFVLVDPGKASRDNLFP